MFISRDQKERDSATAYRTSALRCDQMVSHECCCSCRWLSISVLLSGMMVEVLGTVVGTAIQGQIVGGARDCPTELDVTDSRNVTKINMSRVSLDETVSLLCQVTFTTVWYSVFKWWCKLTLSFCPQKQAYLIASGVICIIYVLCATVLFLGVKEQKGMNLWRNKRSSHLSDARVET